ncbi:enoyl-CoA hydratase [Paraburkholderia phymatum]|uniref:enoyl-CoA hydratase n=1 Tax=Paraburkholderia phymatum TaxID=148447 RepID=UPI00317CF524
MSLVLYEVDSQVAILTLNRPDQRNAQNPPLLEELDAAFDRAIADDDVRVIVLNAAGKHFSAGHDISPDVLTYEPWASMFSDVERTGLLRMYNWETKHFLGYARKWRELPKPTIASVQGACIAAGLMLVWPMDLIVAADNAKFSDPVVMMGCGGVEYHGHTWELGPRKAKEMLFTGAFIDAHEAHRLGMVNRVVPLEQLGAETMALARQIAQRHPHPLLMAKRAVNQTMDIMGMDAAVKAVFDIHSLGHANAWATCGQPTIAGLAEMAPANKAARQTAD